MKLKDSSLEDKLTKVNPITAKKQVDMQPLFRNINGPPHDSMGSKMTDICDYTDNIKEYVIGAVEHNTGTIKNTI